MVRLEDWNGPRGGPDKRRRIEAHIAVGGSLVVDFRDVELEPAIAPLPNASGDGSATNHP